MQGRICGGCTLCCRLVGVPETRKPAGTWCLDCVQGQGCGVHVGRPQSCRNFDCFWLMDEQFPEDMRPDRCGVVVYFNDDDGVVLFVDPDRPDALAEPPGQDWLSALLNAYERLYVVCGSDRFMIRREEGTEA